MKKIWFAAKTYGYGWTPATWEGWLVTLGYIVITFVTAYALDMFALPDLQSTLIFVLLMTLYTVILIVICVRTGEPARWRWGKKDQISE